NTLLAFPGFDLDLADALHFALELHSRLHNLRLPDLLHQVGYAALLDKLWADIFSEGRELPNRWGVAEEAGEEVEALNESDKEISERLPVLSIGDLGLEP